MNLALDLVDASTERSCLTAFPVQNLGELLFETSKRVFDGVGMQNLGLEACQQLVLQRHPRNQQIVCTDAITSVGVHRTPIARVVALSPLAGNDGYAAVTDRALKKPSEEIRGSSRPTEPWPLSRSAVIEPLYNLYPPARCRPQLFGNDALLGDLSLAPLTGRFSPIDPLPRFLGSHLLRFPPDHEPAVSLIVEDVPNRGRTPAPRHSSFLRLWRENSLVVEIDGDPLQGVAGRIPLENSPDGGRLVGVDCQFNAGDDWPAVAVSFRAALDWHAAIAENAAASMQSLDRPLLDAAESALRQILEV